MGSDIGGISRCLAGLLLLLFSMFFPTSEVALKGTAVIFDPMTFMKFQIPVISVSCKAAVSFVDLSNLLDIINPLIGVF